MSSDKTPGSIRLALPKGRMYDQVLSLLKGAGISVRQSERGYRPVSYTHLTLPTTPYV